MIFYNLLIFMTIVFLGIKNNKIKKIIFDSFFSFLVLIVGLRSIKIGNDTRTYIKIFENLNYINLNESYIEKGYLSYNLFVKYFSEKQHIFLLTTAIITYFGIYVFIKRNSSNIFFSLFLLISLRYYGDSMNIIRQMMALSFVLLAFELLKAKKNKTFFTFNILAYLFHSSALVFMIIYFFRRIRFNKKYLVSIFITSIVFILFSKFFLKIIFQIPIFEKYSVYVNSIYFTSWNLGIVFNVGLSLIIMLGYYFYFINFKEQLSYEENLKMWIISFAFLFSSFAIVGSLMSRIALYYSFFSIILIPEIFTKVKNKESKIVLFLSIFVLLFLYHFITLYYKAEWNYIYPYKFFWE